MSREVSVAAMIEFAMWIAIPYLIAGMVWTFFDAGDVAQIETRLETSIPAGPDWRPSERPPAVAVSASRAPRSARPDADRP